MSWFWKFKLQANGQWLSLFFRKKTLQQSKNEYPEEWDTLLLDVGFSTISGLTYTDNGSYITDFFVDNNVEFTVENIKLLSFLIKIYAFAYNTIIMSIFVCKCIYYEYVIYIRKNQAQTAKPNSGRAGGKGRSCTYRNSKNWTRQRKFKFTKS